MIGRVNGKQERTKNLSFMTSFMTCKGKTGHAQVAVKNTVYQKLGIITVSHFII